MNANELADLIGMCGDGGYNQDAATMLRQQQAEIEALKMDIHSLTYGERLTKYFNEPVAYIDPYDLERLPHYDCHIGSQQLKNGIPLYTHPVKEQDESFDRTASHMAGEYVSYKAELTDEEILIVWTSSNFVRYTENGHIDEIFFNKFARAILRKAQEK